MSPRRSNLSLNQMITISVAIIAIIATIFAAFVSGHDWFPNILSRETEYVGRVIDSNNQQPVVGAKVTLDLAGVPPIVYTDSEGVYRFNVATKSNLSGQIRIDAQGYQVYTRNISLTSRLTIIEDIRLTPRSSVTPSESTTLIPSPDRTPEESGQIFIVDVQPSSGSKVPPGSSACLWTEASGQGAYIVLTLEQESVIYTLRVALSEPFVTRLRLTFSDNSQQTVDLDEIKTYAYQEVTVEPVKTSSITVEVLEVKDNLFSNFGICHIEVFGIKSSQALTPDATQILQEMFNQIDSQFRGLPKVNIAFNKPEQMEIDKTAIVELILNPSLSESALSTEVVERGNFVTSTAEPYVLIAPSGETVTVETSQIEITPRMKAVLLPRNSEAFTIQEMRDSAEQVVSSDRTTSWRWSVTAKKEGLQTLELVIFQLVKYDGKEFWSEVETYKANILVKVTVAQNIKSLDWKWIVGGLATLLLIPAFWRWYDQRGKQMDQISKPNQQTKTSKIKRKL